MRLSSMADYAVVIMSAAARHCGTCSLAELDGKKRARVSAGQLAEETGDGYWREVADELSSGV